MAKRYALSHRHWERLKEPVRRGNGLRAYRPAVFSRTSMPVLPGATRWLGGAVQRQPSSRCSANGRRVVQSGLWVASAKASHRPSPREPITLRWSASLFSSSPLGVRASSPQAARMAALPGEEPPPSPPRPFGADQCPSQRARTGMATTYRGKVVHGMHPTELWKAPRYTTEETALGTMQAEPRPWPDRV